MKVSLKQEIIRAFKLQFEANCVSLLFEGYSALLETKRDVRESNENDITAQLVGGMMKSQKRYDLNISINREAYLDDENVYNGIKEADKSPRIDIRYVVWNSSEEVEYFMEAKNLAEINWKKTGSSSDVNAQKLQKRYVSTGIGNFITKRYENGCLLGYILQGDTQKIVNKINEHLAAASRDNEKLVIASHDSFNYYYVSKHATPDSFELKHFMLLFC